MKLKTTITFLLACLYLFAQSQGYSPQVIYNNGNATGSEMSVGSKDAFGLNIKTNNTNRIRLSSGGRMFSGTLTDFILTSSDSAKIAAATIDLAGAMKLTGNVIGNGTVMSITGSNQSSIESTNHLFVASSTDLNAVGDTLEVTNVIGTGTAQAVLAMKEDADNSGDNRVSIQAANSLSADYVQTLTSASGFIPAVLKGSATLDFPSTAASASSDLTITVTGAADGDVVSLGVPNASVVSNTIYTARVSAANTVTVTHSNLGTLAPSDPASGTFTVHVSK